MSITSKIVISALLIGVSLPAFAQGTTTTTPASHAPLVHKIATPAEPLKATTGATTTLKTPAVKTDGAMKSDLGKPAVNTGIAKPVTPPAVKTN